jgi:FHS family L-fucose permease-like MFS transporter
MALVLTAMLTTRTFRFGQYVRFAVGLFNSSMFRTIFTLAIDGLGRHTGQTSGILCMAIVGGAVGPAVQGFLADSIGIQHAFILPVLCFAYIVFYGWKGQVPSYKQVV